MLDTSEKNDETPPKEDLLQKEGRSCLERRTVLVERQTDRQQLVKTMNNLNQKCNPKVPFPTDHN